MLEVDRSRQKGLVKVNEILNNVKDIHCKDKKKKTVSIKVRENVLAQDENDGNFVWIARKRWEFPPHFIFLLESNPVPTR